MEYKLLCYNWDNGTNKTPLYANGQEATRFSNPAVDADLNTLAANGWQVISVTNNGKGGMFFLLERSTGGNKYMQ